MRITELSAVNFKVGSFKEELAPVTIFAAGNFRGKSSRIQAIILALAGYLPGVPKKPNEIFEQLSSGNPMGVSVLFDNANVGHHSRQWEAVRGGTVKYTGSDYTFPAVGIDATEYLSLSSKEKVKFLFGRSKLGPEFEPKKVIEFLKTAITHTEFHESGAAVEQAKTAAVQYLSHHIDYSASTQSIIEQLAADCKEHKLSIDAGIRRMSQTAQGMTQVASETSVPANAEQMLSVAREFLRTAVDEKVKLETQLGECRKQHRTAEAKASSWKNDNAPKLDNAALEKQISKLQQETLMIPATEKARESDTKIQSSRSKQEAKCDAIRAEVETLVSAIDSVAKLTLCAECGQKISPAHKKKTTAAKKKQLADVRKRLQAAESELSELNKQGKLSKIALSEVEKSISQHLEKLQTLSRAQSRLAENQAMINGAADAERCAAQLPELLEKGRALKMKYEAQLVVAEGYRQDVIKAEENFQKLQQQRSEAATRAKTIEEANRLKAEQEVFKELLRLIAEQQERMVEQAVGPILKTCNDLFGDILVHLMEYQDGEIGFRHRGSGKFIRCQQPYCSGTEAALSHAALSVALATDAPFKLVILDELSLDLQNKTDVVCKLMDLVDKGKIDQAIIADASLPESFEADLCSPPINHENLLKVIRI